MRAEVGRGGCEVLQIWGWSPSCQGTGGWYGKVVHSCIRGSSLLDCSRLTLGGVYSRVLHAHEVIDDRFLGQLPDVKHRQGEIGPR